MRFAFTSDQLAFRDAVRDLLTKQCPPEAVRAACPPGPGYDPDTWSLLADMGVLGLLAPEDAGGLGLSQVDLVLILEETGRACLPGPVVEHVAVAVPALATAGAGEVAAAAAGNLVVTVAEPGCRTVAYGAEAGLVLRLEGDRAVAVEGAVATREERSVDGSRRLAQLEGGSAAPLGGVEAALLRARAAAGTAAQLCGLAGRMIEMTADYVKERHQFGVPIGSFQAVKHMAVDLYTAIERARVVVQFAALTIAEDDHRRTLAASMAKAVAGDAQRIAAQHGVQLFGGLGYTWENDLQLFLRRAKVGEMLLGSAHEHRLAVGHLVVDGLGPEVAR